MSYKIGTAGPCAMSGCRNPDKDTAPWRNDAAMYLCERHYKGNKREIAMEKQAKNFEPMGLSEALEIVRRVWKELRYRPTPFGLPNIYPVIREGYKIDRRFYHALQTVLLDPATCIHVHVMGAPAQVGKNQRVFLRTDTFPTKYGWYKFFQIDEELEKRMERLTI